MTRSRPDLHIDEKNRMAQFLFANSIAGVVHRGKIKECVASFGVSRRTVQYIWASAKKQVSEGIPILLTSKKKGMKRRCYLHLDIEYMKNIAFQKRSTIRSLAKELGINKSHVGRWIKAGLIRPHTNAIKELTEHNKFQRLTFCLNALSMDRAANIIQFSGMHNVVHIDEKWFYISRTCERYYMVPDEEEPHGSCKSKRFIPKIMFMSAVSRPIYSNDGQLLLDGKIGIFPFTEQKPAKRNSKNRARGTMVTTPIESITKDVIRNCLVHQIIPAIKAKWPPNASKFILIQQDNAKPHIMNNDPEFREAASSDGFNIQLVCQPPKSPDTNINDLGWFRAIQSLQVDTASYNVDQLVKNVLKSYQDLTTVTLNNVFLSLQGTLIEIMKVYGHNNYKVPHMGKGRLIREDRLPMCLDVDEVLVRECIQFLINAGQIDTSSYNIGGLMADLRYV